jgi:ADP-ribosyl-[dinitrogen reductase] hydrolase
MSSSAFRPAHPRSGNPRARGALMGLAVGDALGTTNEFAHLSAPAFPTKAAGPLRDIVGGGPFRVQAGQVTDDTHMAICLADSLVERGGFDAADVAARYVEWTHAAFDVGAQTSAALRAIASGVAVDRAGRQIWLDRGRNAAGNGSLMRTAPIGVLVDDVELRRRVSMDDSAITHFDPRCQIACAAFNAAIAAGVRGGTAQMMMDAASAEVAEAARLLAARQPELAQEIAAAQSALTDDLELARAANPELYGPELHLLKQQGFVRVAFRLAFWELMHAYSFEEALIDVVNRGGDADTNGAITGALLGALWGEDAIPGAWRDPVLRALPEDGANPLSTRYHPRRFMEITTRNL